MQPIAEVLRYVLILLQSLLFLFMVISGLWRRLPIWTTWLLLEIASRVPFAPTGYYAHHIWLPLQPALLLMLAAAAIEARYQTSRYQANAFVLAALMVAPFALGMEIRSLIVSRMWITGALALFLVTTTRGTFTARAHSRIFAALCAMTAVFGWMPRKDGAWWTMRAGYLAGYCVICAAWLWLFNRRDPAAPAAPEPAR